jgi:processive 1,2-diacylglycerol beta-glucosyltransferase
MRVACVYINAGKGHYIPARAISDGLVKLGVEAPMVDFFDMIGARRLDRFNQWMWRWQLRFPAVERSLNGAADRSRLNRWLLPRLQWIFYRRHFSAYIRENHYDAVICTHYMPSQILSIFYQKLQAPTDVFAYASDVFFTPRIGIHPNLRKFYISTEEGRRQVVAAGLADEQVVLAPFPIQSSCVSAPQLTKQEARASLDLEDRFTILVNLGGEGIGTVALVEELELRGAAVQAVLVGGMQPKVRTRLEELKQQCKAVKIHVAGFVDNIYDYLYAADIVVGKAGINAMLEALYIRRPFLVTTLYYTVAEAAEYFERYQVGWYAPRVKDQADIIGRYIEEPMLLDEIQENFAHVPITFGSEGIAQDMIETVGG